MMSHARALQRDDIMLVLSYTSSLVNRVLETSAVARAVPDILSGLDP